MPGLARRQAGATSALLVVRASEHLDLAPSGYGVATRRDRDRRGPRAVRADPSAGCWQQPFGIQAVYYLGGGLLLLAGAIGWCGVRTQ